MKSISTRDQAISPPVRKRASGFAIGWLSITVVTVLVFVAFAGPLFGNGQTAAFSESLSTGTAPDRTL